MRLQQVIWWVVAAHIGMVGLVCGEIWVWGPQVVFIEIARRIAIIAGYTGLSAVFWKVASWERHDLTYERDIARRARDQYAHLLRIADDDATRPCAHCRRPPAEHAAARCLFEPTSYAPRCTTCEGLRVIPLVGAPFTQPCPACAADD